LIGVSTTAEGIMIQIEQVPDLPLSALAPLIGESGEAGFRHLRRLVDEWQSGANRFNRPGEALFVAKACGDVVGVCGLNQDPYAAASHSGHVRRLYVSAAHRRCDVGTALIAGVIETARKVLTQLTVRTKDPEADRFFRSLGFERVQELNNPHTLQLVPDRR
jgi:N-acetylglutamate synthase-like GNAT family acetyltransferase